MLKTRLITGVILIGLVFWTIFSLPPQAIVIVAGLLGFGMMREWISLVGIQHRFARIAILDLFLALEFVVYWFLPQTQLLLWAAGLFWLIVIPFLWQAQRAASLPKLKKGTLIFTGYFILLAFFAGILKLRTFPGGDWLVVMAFVIVWSADSIAYAVGHLIGKHKLISKVSPGKTWEGFIGGALLTLPVLGLYWVYVLKQPFPPVLWFAWMLYLVLMALLGDLFESLIKRMHNAKDSGTILPGHGGLLDRFDSLIAVAPVFALLILEGLV